MREEVLILGRTRKIVCAHVERKENLEALLVGVAEEVPNGAKRSVGELICLLVSRQSDAYIGIPVSKLIANKHIISELLHIFDILKNMSVVDSADLESQSSQYFMMTRESHHVMSEASNNKSAN